MKEALTIISLNRKDGRQVKFQELKKYIGYMVQLFTPVVSFNVSNDMSECWIIVREKHAGTFLALMEQSMFFNNFNISVQSLAYNKMSQSAFNFSMN